MTERKRHATVTDYFADLSGAQRTAMEELRGLIRAVLPDGTTEQISYQIPSFRLDGKAVVWYAAFRRHLSLFPASDAMRAAVGEELEPYRTGKGTLRFPLGQPLPADIIRRAVAFRLGQVRGG
jgi:uncharacterized protein YdhG (YjbR/CyaY superfamily)